MMVFAFHIKLSLYLNISKIALFHKHYPGILHNDNFTEYFWLATSNTVQTSVSIERFFRKKFPKVFRQTFHKSFC